MQRVPNPEVVRPAPITTVKVLKNVNLRKGLPNTTAQIVRVLLANSEVTVSGFTLGERVNGNACWYVDTQKQLLVGRRDGHPQAHGGDGNSFFRPCRLGRACVRKN